MTLFLLRHAERRMGAPSDPGLSSKGGERAAALGHKLAEAIGDRDFLIFSSPMKRCLETLKPLSEKSARPIIVNSLLIEQQGGDEPENYVEFLRRVQFFLEDAKRHSFPVTVACSHADWLAVAMQWMGISRGEFREGDWVRVDFSPSEGYR